MSLVQQIEQVYKDTGQLITAFIPGEIEGEAYDEDVQPDTPVSLYANVESVAVEQRNGASVKVVKFFVSNANDYKPEISNRVIIGGNAFTISSVSEDIFGSEIISYTCEGVG